MIPVVTGNRNRKSPEMSLLGPSPCHSFCASPSFCCYALQALGEVKKKKAKQKKKQKEKERKHQAQGLQGKGGATRELRCDA